MDLIARISVPRGELGDLWLPKQYLTNFGDAVEVSAFKGCAWVYPDKGGVPIYAATATTVPTLFFPAITSEDMLKILPMQYAPEGHAGRFNLRIMYKEGQFSISYVATGSFLQLAATSGPNLVVALFLMYVHLRSQFKFTATKKEE